MAEDCGKLLEPGTGGARANSLLKVAQLAAVPDDRPSGGEEEEEEERIDKDEDD